MSAPGLNISDAVPALLLSLHPCPRETSRINHHASQERREKKPQIRIKTWGFLFVKYLENAEERKLTSSAACAQSNTASRPAPKMPPPTRHCYRRCCAGWR